MINPTLKKPTAARSESPIKARDSSANGKQNPATTKKFDAFVNVRRGQMEEKKYNEDGKV